MLLKNQMEKEGVWLFRFRGILPLIVLVLGVYKCLHAEMHPEIYRLEGTKYEIWYDMLCLAVGLLGLMIRVITVGHTPRNTSGRNVEGQVADELNTTGMYSIVRNPLYLGNFFMWAGIAMLTMDPWFIAAFVFMYWVYYERIIYAEEQFLEQKFGDPYRKWADRTPCFIPRLRGYEKPALGFSWKKVIKKEKIGLLALLLIFSTLDLVGGWIMNRPPHYLLLSFVTVAVLAFYLVIKYLKHNTSLLDESGR